MGSGKDTANIAILKAYTLASLRSTRSEVRNLEELILEHQYGLFAYLTARDIPGCRKRIMQRVVIEEAKMTRDAKLLYIFARDVPGASKALLGRIIKELGDHGWIEAFRRIPA